MSSHEEVSHNKKRRKEEDDDDDDGLNDDDDFLEEDSDEEEEERPVAAAVPVHKKPKLSSRAFIDDAAQESGEENDDDDDEEDEDEDDNEYKKDGFVVDEVEEEEEIKKRDDLEDSEDEDSDEEEDDDDDDDDDDVPTTGSKKGKTQKKSRLKKIRRATERLDEDDLALIQEHQRREAGLPLATASDEDDDEDAAYLKQVATAAAAAAPVKPVERVVAKTEEELQKELFAGADDDDEDDDINNNRAAKLKPLVRRKVDRYDEDGMDDFIEDDIGDQDEIFAAERRGDNDGDGRGWEVNEAQLTEASEIFGTDYLAFMDDDKGEEDDDDDEEDLMGRRRDKFRERGVGVQYGVDSDEDEAILSDEDDDDLFAADDDDDDYMGGLTSQQKAEALRLKREKRKLEREERRRLARQKKAERRKRLLRLAFEPVQLVENFCTERDDDIRQVDIPERFYDWKVPFYGSPSPGLTAEEEEQARWIAQRIPEIATELAVASEDPMQHESMERVIFQSIANALRYMHQDKLEPAFIKRYRADYIESAAVRNNLYRVLDEDGEWDRIRTARGKVEELLESLTASAQQEELVGADAQALILLQEELADAQKKLDETAKQESHVSDELAALKAMDEDEDDDELFGDADEDEEKKRNRERLTSHLATIQSLLEARADKVSQLQARIVEVEEQNRALNDPGPMERVTKKMNRDCLWNSGDYARYLSNLSDSRHILDMNAYLNLIKEGNDAIRKKELPLLADKDGKTERNRRSRRFDRDFYRTCVSEGLRDICYRYLLAPNRVGIKLEDTIKTGGFDFTKTLPGEENAEGSGNPMKWVPPTIPTSPPEGFASDLIGSGELIVLGEAAADGKKDPLRGCRYVAAMELAYEPRVRRCLRDIFRRHAVISTKPTKKGLEEIDAFHDYYGVHLIRGKPVKDHFPMEENEAFTRRVGMSVAEINELDREMKKREKESCLQYLTMLKAESTGDITVHIHMPLLERYSDWWKADNEQLFSRSNQDVHPLMSELLKAYMPPDGDTHEWEEERKKVLHSALRDFLLPQFEAETRRDLREAAAQMGVAAAAENLRETAMEGPYRPAAISHIYNRFIEPTGDLPIVGVCCANEGKDATYLASVTEQGKSNDFLAVPAGMKVDSPKMREKVITFLLQSRPAAVVVGTSGGFESRQIQRKLTDLIAEAVRRWSSRDIQGDDEDDDAFHERQQQFRQFQPQGYYDEDDEDESWTCNVELIDDSVAGLFGRSVRSKKEFPEYSVNLKSAIAVARYAKDPLAELTYAWSVASDAGMFGTEMLFLNIHPSQQLLPKTMLLRQYERVLCEVVADVGVDLNACCTFDHLRGLLMFVPGLGPRKAANLKQIVTKIGDTICRRKELLEKRLIGNIVYNNAVAFLRISDLEQHSEQLFHPLDETRLHPDTYIRNTWAIKIAVDALEREEQSTAKEQAAFKALHDVMENSRKEVKRLFEATKAEWERLYGPTFNIKDWDPRINVPSDQWHDKVEDLDLEAYAGLIERNNHGKWLSHLDMIKWEFRLPFADPRKPMEPLSGDKLFRLITGETDQSVRPGKELTGKVIANGDFGSRVKVEGDIPAFIPLRNLSDEHVETAEDIVSPGQVVTAIVTEVKKDHMTINMSLKLEDFRKKPGMWERPSSLPPIDGAHFDTVAASAIDEFNAKARDAHIDAIQRSLGTKSADGEAPKKSDRYVHKRACTHPAFVNGRQDEVDRRLREGGASMVGEAIIRPSSKSPDSLAIHWVVREGSIKVFEVIEEDKETEASIGNKLIVKGEVYESIDELLGRFIEPMNEFVDEIVNHRKFMDLPEDEVDDHLIAQKKINPKSIPYAICWMEMHPGYASLRFVANTTPRNHLIGVTPKGFSWNTDNYPSLDQLVNAFKKNPRGPSKPKAKAPAPPPPSKGRWGSKPAAPPPPPVPPAAPPVAAWAPRPPPPPLPPVMPPPIPAATGYRKEGGWGPPVPPRPPMPPPPYHQQQQPPRPPMPHPQPPPPPPAFDIPSAASQGRGRGRTLPAWMSKN